MTSESSLALTIDVDWAPDAVLADTISLIDGAGLSATIFATHATTVLDGLDPNRFEVALHPNLNPALAGAEDFRAPIDRIRQLWPSACGVRSHSLVQGGPIWEYFVQCGLWWESNLLLPFAADPFRDCSGMVRVPFGWSDYCTLWSGNPFDMPRISGATEGTGVFAFHPIHIYLNSEERTRYDKARPHYKDPEVLEALRHRGPAPGARDALLALMAMARAAQRPSVTLSSLALSADGLAV
jgi:hypothetical protein